MTVLRVTGARNGVIVGTMLAVCCCAATAAANEPSSRTSSDAPPAFVGRERLPQLQEAWRNHQAEAGSENANPSDAPVMVPPLDVEASAKERHEAGVRLRAEELSRRFFATSGAKAAGVAAGTASDADKPPLAKSDRLPMNVATQPPPQTEAPAQATAAPTSDILPPPYAVGADLSADRGDDTTTSALPEPSQPASADAAAPAAGNLMPARQHSGLPPLPMQRPDPAATPPSRTAAREPIPQARRTIPTVSAPSREQRLKDAKREVFPSYLHSFGWDPRR